MTTMELKFNDIEAYCLTVPWEKDRIKFVTKVFDDAKKEIEFIYGEKTDPYSKGLAQGHIDALSKSKGNPCLIMEDDVTPTPYWDSKNFCKETFHLPEWADALYIGTSVFGRIKGTTQHRGLLASGYSDKLLRVYNMLSLHAVIYISSEYKSSCIKAFKNYVDNPKGGCDDPIGDAMKNFNVFCLKDPYFYQNDGHGNESTLTKPKNIL